MKRKKWKSKFSKNAKVKKIISKIIYILLSILILYNIVYLIHTAITKQEYFQILNISIFNKKDKLMEDEIKKNDLVIINGNIREIKKDDIIAYKVNAEIRINKVYRKDIDENKEEIIITKSNKNFQPDEEKILKGQIIGKMVYRIPFLGLIIEIMQAKTTSIIILISLLIKFNYNKYLNKKQRERKKKKKEKEFL